MAAMLEPPPEIKITMFFMSAGIIAGVAHPACGIAQCVSHRDRMVRFWP
jgi:hypothetical protein